MGLEPTERKWTAAPGQPGSGLFRACVEFSPIPTLSSLSPPIHIYLGLTVTRRLLRPSPGEADECRISLEMVTSTNP